MGLQDVVSAERLHIGFFGMRNAGKSSLVNKITGQQTAVVSDVKGTTTDPVKKAMELLPLGPVVILDTPGLDDEGELGSLRVEKAMEMLKQTDIAVVVADAVCGLGMQDQAFIRLLKERQIPYLVVYNKADLLQSGHDKKQKREEGIMASALTGEGIEEIKEKLGDFAATRKQEKYPAADLIDPGDIVLLVTPIDKAAPKGRLILPQQLVIRDILDHHGIAVICQEGELADTLCHLQTKPKMVITDSQVFERVSRVVPETIFLTSFSILMARYKGDLKELVKGAAFLSHLKEGDRVLISEGCTHHRQCNDIGTVKMPRFIEEYTGKKTEKLLSEADKNRKSLSAIQIEFTSGGDFPKDLSKYDLIVHCGGCMLKENEMAYRINQAVMAGVPIVNYGIAIAAMHGILKRSVELFPDVYALLEQKV